MDALRWPEVIIIIINCAFFISHVTWLIKLKNRLVLATEAYENGKWIAIS